MTGTQEITEGAKRHLIDLGFSCLCEFTLSNARRVDVIGLNRKGEIYVVEVKSGVADFRSDQKWQDYLMFCDYFSFAVDEHFPQELIPEDCGLIVADQFEGVALRSPSYEKLNAARRKAMTLKFARVAAERLETLINPV